MAERYKITHGFGFLPADVKGETLGRAVAALADDRDIRISEVRITRAHLFVIATLEDPTGRPVFDDDPLLRAPVWLSDRMAEQHARILALLPAGFGT